MRISRVFCCTLLGIVLVGCVSFGEKVSDESEAKIVVGKTTRLEVDRLLGKPTEKLNTENSTLYRFSRTQMRPYEAGLTTAGIRLSSFDVLFDEAGIVKKVHRYESRDVLRGSALSGRTQLGKPITEDDISKIVKGETKLKELKVWFGEATIEQLAFDETITRVWSFYLQGHTFRSPRLHRLIVYFDLDDTAEGYQLSEEQL